MKQDRCGNVTKRHFDMCDRDHFRARFWGWRTRPTVVYDLCGSLGAEVLVVYVGIYKFLYPGYSLSDNEINELAGV